MEQNPLMKKIALIAGTIAICAVAFLVFEMTIPPHPAKNASGQAPSAPPVDLPALKAKADGGDAEARVQLGKLYTKGQAVPFDFKRAAKLFQQAADQGNAEAQTCLGELYDAGRGVPKDLNEAIKLYKLAAAQGNAGAQYNLAFMCEQGRGLPLDRVQAAKWYQLAAEGGDALAQYDLGQRYDFGVGVPTNRVEALKWLRLAAAQGQVDAAERLKSVKAKMSREEIAEAERRVAAFAPRTDLSNPAKP